MTMREKVIEEVNRVPEEQLDNVLELIHHFRLELEASQTASDIMELAGSWKDMPEEEFEDFLEEVQMRRRRSSRRKRYAADTA